MKNRKKLVTADDYRKDRDYWKRRALKQQNVINTINRHNDRLTNANNATNGALEATQQRLKEVCPHDVINSSLSSVYENEIYCDRCNSFVKNDGVKESAERAEQLSLERGTANG